MAMIIRGGRRTADWPDPDREPERRGGRRKSGVYAGRGIIEDLWPDEEPENKPIRSLGEILKDRDT